MIFHTTRNIVLFQVFNLSGHLVYWGKAIFIYPLCETNVYMTAPGAPVHSRSHLVEKFTEQFPGYSLIQVSRFFYNIYYSMIKFVLGIIC